MRTFIAIKPKINVKGKQLLSDLKQALSEQKIKWVEHDNLHITLKFLGKTEERKINDIIQVISKTSREFNPFDIQIKGPGYFPSYKKPMVIWLGTESDGMIENIHNHLDNELSKIGFKPETREFKAHITIGRVKKINDYRVFKTLAEENKHFIEPTTIDRIIFYESKLTSQGPVYSVLKSCELKKASY